MSSLTGTTKLYWLALVCISAAEPALRGAKEPLGSNVTQTILNGARRTGSLDGTVVNSACVDYTGEGYFPGRGDALIDGMPAGLIARPPTLSACELEQLHTDCVDRINMYRSGELKFSDGTEDTVVAANPSPALTENTGFNQCSSHQAAGDLNIMFQGAGCAHYTSGTCPLGGSRGQNSCCPRGSSNDPLVTYDAVKEALFGCLQSMWDEAMGNTDGTNQGHHDGMQNTNFQYASCGFAWNSNGQVLMTQDFTSATPPASSICSCEGKSAGESDGCGGVCAACVEPEPQPCTDNPGTGVWSSTCTGETNQCTCQDHMTLGHLGKCDVERVQRNCPVTCNTCPTPSPTCPDTSTTAPVVATTTSTTTTPPATTTTTTTVIEAEMVRAEIVEGSTCSGNDCYSYAVCPSGTSVVECASDPMNAGDGLQVTSTKCTARGGSSRRRNRRRSMSIKAIAVCSSSQTTSVAVSDEKYLDNQLVTAYCPSGDIIGCYCHSSWGSSICGGTTTFASVNMELVGPSTPTCAKNIGSSPGRRRNRDGGAGAKIYALCDTSSSSAVHVSTAWGTPCSGDDCSSVAACPSGTSVLDCASLPAHAGDGIQVQSTKCVARGSRHVDAIQAVAVCSPQDTSVVVSSDKYLDDQEVSASCASGTPLSCYCQSAWTSSICGDETEFQASGSTCTKNIGNSPGRRRMVDGGAGAKIYALCRGVQV